MPCPTCGGDTLDLASVKMSNNCIGVGWSDKLARLTPHQFLIVRRLVLAAPAAVSVEQLLAEMYGMADREPDTAERALLVQVARARKLIAPLDLVISPHIRGVGYVIHRFGRRVLPLASRNTISAAAAAIRAVGGGA